MCVSSALVNVHTMRLMRLTQCSLRGVYQLSGGVASGRSATNRATPSSLLLFISIYQAAALPVCPHSSISNYGYYFRSTPHFCNLKLQTFLVYEFEEDVTSVKVKVKVKVEVVKYTAAVQW